MATKVERGGARMIVTHRRIAGWHACPKDAEIARQLYPDGVPVTFEAAVALREAGADPLWGLLHLLTAHQRREFVVFTLRQRQPHLVALLRKARLDTHADAVAALDWGDLRAAVQVCDAAMEAARDAVRSAVWDAAWDAARNAARDAAWDTAWDTAWAAARNAARDAAWDTAWAAARNAARDAAWSTRGAVRRTARDAQLRWCIEAVTRREVQAMAKQQIGTAG